MSGGGGGYPSGMNTNKKNNSILKTMLDEVISNGKKIDKLNRIEQMSESHCAGVITFLKETDQNNVWDDNGLESIRLFMKSAYKAGFKEALKD